MTGRLADGARIPLDRQHPAYEGRSGHPVRRDQSSRARASTLVPGEAPRRLVISRGLPRAGQTAGLAALSSDCAGRPPGFRADLRRVGSSSLNRPLLFPAADGADGRGPSRARGSVGRAAPVEGYRCIGPGLVAHSHSVTVREHHPERGKWCG